MSSPDEKVICLAAHTMSHLVRALDPGRNKFVPAEKCPLGHIVNVATSTTDMTPILLPRKEADDPANAGRFKHLIAYTVVTAHGNPIHYLRSKKGAESRLHAFRSIGFGGHLTVDDIGKADPKIHHLTAEDLVLAARRELDEELEMPNEPYPLKYVGILSDDSSDVNRVHLGLIFEARIGLSLPRSREDAIADVKVSAMAQLRQMNPGTFESWSEILIKEVMGDPMYTCFH